MKKTNKLNRRLAAYSAAAAAAIAIAPAADAAIVYSGIQNLTVNTSNSHYIDINNDGSDDFYIAVSTYTSIGLSAAYIVSVTSGFGHIAETIHNDPARLPYGYTIQNTVTYPNYWTSSEWNTLNGTVFGYTSSMGNFRNGAQGYIGVRFGDPTCRTAYGWIQYRGTGIATGTIIDWAYEDACGPIQAGYGAVAATVPTMGEWGMLALAGLLSALSIKAINREEETA